MTERESHLKEWAPLSDLLLRLPSKLPIGLLYRDVKLTCVDVLSEFIALGTNLGVVYWYNRKTKDMQKLKCETTTTPVTVVKIISTVDYMLASGNTDGLISIFQIPKQYPDSIPESLKPKNKSVERYTVSELHKGPITALEWSKNGMKLFSGDKNGMVVITELDFYMHLCKSAEILNESYEVVQLSYHQQNLLISTTYRSIICQQLDKWKISQVGKKDRKVLGTFGGIFCKTGLRLADTTLYCTRPGLRIWVSDVLGCVQQTLLFKELLNVDCPEVPLMNPISESARALKPQKEASFGVLLPFEEELLVTYSSDFICVLNPKEMSVIATVSNLRRVLSVATTKNEIFVLEGARSLIRLSTEPESTSEINDIPTPTTLTSLAPTLHDLTLKLQVSNIISAIPPLIETPKNGLDIYTDPTAVSNAEEATESLQNDATDATNKKFEIYNRIGELQFEDTILYKHHKRRKKPRGMSSSVTSLSSSSSEERDGGVGDAGAMMTLSAFGVLPDLRSPDSIQTDIEYKERILADVLNFDKVKMEGKESSELSCSEESPSSKIDPQSSSVEESGSSREYLAVSPRSSEAFCIRPNVFPKFGGSRVDFGERQTQNESTHVHVLKDAPACLNIPNSWKLSNIQLRGDNYVSPVTDAVLADWEII